MDAIAVFFWLLAALAVAGAMLVVITPHIVHAAVGLILALSAVAGLFFLAGAEFLGAMQIMIYVGGTVVLLAFGVMLTARLTFVRMRTTADQWVIAILLAAPLATILLQSAWAYGHLKSAQLSLETKATKAEVVSATDLGLALVGVRPQVDGVNGSERQSALDQTTRDGYILPFELVSLHLVVVMVGAAYLARRRME